MVGTRCKQDQVQPCKSWKRRTSGLDFVQLNRKPFKGLKTLRRCPRIHFSDTKLSITSIVMANQLFTWVLAEVGKTRIWVQVTSWGVESWQLTEAWLNRSSGVNWSGISLRAESGSRETRQALRILGTSVVGSKLHWVQISRRCFDALSRDFRLRSQLQPGK